MNLEKCLKMISKDHDKVKPKNETFKNKTKSVASSSELLLLKL